MRARKFPEARAVRQPVQRPERSDAGPHPTPLKARNIGEPKTKWRDEWQPIVVQLYGRGWTMIEIARLIGVSPNLLWKWRQLRPELKKAMEQAHNEWRLHADDRVV